MTDTINTVLAAALEVLPMLSDENDNYCIKSTDTAEVVSGKIYDVFNYGLDDAQYNALVESARKSTDRAKALAAIKDWSDGAADSFEAELEPKDLGDQAALFAEFPSLDEADDDDDVLTVGYALTRWPSGVPLPKQITAELQDASILPNVEEQLAALFKEDKKTTRSRRQRRSPEPEPELSETDKALAALADISDLVGDNEVTQTLENTDEANAAKKANANAEAKAEAEAKAKAKAEAEAKAEEKAKKEAEEKAKKEAEKKAKKEAEEKAKKEAEEKAKKEAEEKARKRSVRTTSISANPYGVVGTMRRILLLDKEIRFDEVALIMADLGVDAKKGTWSPKLSDLRGAYEFFESMGLIDHDQLGKYNTVADLAAVDSAMDPEYTAKLTIAVDKHLKSKK